MGTYRFQCYSNVVLDSGSMTKYAPQRDPEIPRSPDVRKFGQWLSKPIWTNAPERLHKDFGKFELVEDLYYQDKHGRIWVVEKGFIGDFNSIPGLARAIYPKDVALFSPWLHDKLCREQPDYVTSKVAAQLYYEGLRAEGIGPKRAKILAWAVKTFGPRWG